MSCQPELVTGHVDGALDPDDAARIAAHLQGCAECRAQAEAELSLRARLRALPPPAPPFGLDQRVRARLRTSPARRLARFVLPLAATLAALAFWLRGSPGAVAFELAFDHVKCFARGEPPAKVLTGDAAAVEAWFADQGTRLPRLPSETDGLQLHGARYCPLLDGGSVAHVYYVAGSRRLSVFVLPRAVRMPERLEATRYGRAVRLLREGERTIGVVAESEADADAMAAALQPRSARADFRPLG